MRTEKIGKYIVEIYDSIDDLPIKRFHKFNKYLLVDAGVGSDINDVNMHIARIVRYMDKDKDVAKRELENLRQSIYFITEGINVKHLSFIPLIKSINGKEVTDLSDENIRNLSEKLSATPAGFLNRLIESVKKKIDQELSLYFPELDSVKSKEYHDRLQRMSLLKLDKIIRGNNTDAQVQSLADSLLLLTKPLIFSGKKNIEIQYDKDFEEMCLFLQKELSIDIDRTSVLQFYTSFGYVKKLRKNGRQSSKV